MRSVWSICFLLLSCAPAFSADAPPPVFLSHVWIALDQATYDALRTSSQVAALGAVKEQKVVAGSQNWSGFYWTARQTYIEFFGAAALPDETLLGDCGIGLSVETQGGVAAVAERLRTVFGDKVEIEKQVRTTATGDIPWYTSTHMKEPRTTAIWVMELDPGYLAARHPEALVKDPLSRKQERSWDYRPDQTFDNVVGLTLALDQEKTSELATELGRKRRESRWCDAPLQGSPALGRARRLFRRGVPRCVGGSQINDMQLWSVLQRAFVIT